MAQPTTEESQSMLAWVGRYPHERVDDKTFLDSFGLPNRLEELLSEESLARLYKYSVTPPIRNLDNYLIYQGCLPHSCYNHEVVIALDTASDNLFVSIDWNHGEPNFHLYLNGGYIYDMPESVAHALLYMDIQ